MLGEPNTSLGETIQGGITNPLLDDEKLYFGTDSDVYLEWTSATAVLTISNDARFPDDKKLYFGTDEDAYLEWTSATAVLTISNDAKFPDDKKLYFGTDEDTNINWDNSNTRLQLMGPVAVGDAGTTSHTLTANDDLFVSGKLEVDGFIYCDSRSFFYSTVLFADEAMVGFGNAADDDAKLKWSTAQTADCLVFGVGTPGNMFIFTKEDYMAKNHDHAAATDPTLFIQSATNPDTDNTQWLSLAHNQTDGVITTGKGDINLVPSSGFLNVSGLKIYNTTETLADDAEKTIATSTAGFGFAQIGDNQEYALFTWTTAGVVTLISNSANVVNTDTDAKFCIYDAGSGIAIKNRLGSSLTLRFVLNYS